MPPKPLRQTTRKAAASLPATQTAKFLKDAAVNAVADSPQLAAIFGRRCLQTASGIHGALTHTEASSLCKRCGCPLPPNSDNTVEVIKLSKTARRRNKCRSLKASVSAVTAAQYNKAGLVIPCLLCGFKTLKLFYTIEAAIESRKNKPILSRK